MKRIPLRARDGRVRAYALVDDDDFAWLSQWRWSLGGGCVKRTVWHGDSRTYETIRLHHVITGWARVDHYDGDPLNNQRRNLRELGQAQNAQNRGANVNGSSGVRGVTRRRDGWAARAMVAGRPHWLGTYPTIEAAAVVVQAFRREHMPHSNEARHGS